MSGTGNNPTAPKGSKEPTGEDKPGVESTRTKGGHGTSVNTFAFRLKATAEKAAEAEKKQGEQKLEKP